MKIYIERADKNIEKTFNGQAKDLLRDLDILVEDVLVIRNGKLVTEDEELENEDSLRLLSVISGG